MEWKITDIAAHTGLSASRCRQLQGDGMFVQLAGKKTFDSVQCVTSYIEYLRGKTKSAADEKARLDKLRADKIDLEIKVMTAELIDPEIAAADWMKIMQAFRSRALALPTKAAPLLIGTKSAGESQDILNRLVNEMLRELSSPDLVKRALDIQNEKRKKNVKRRK